MSFCQAIFDFIPNQERTIPEAQKEKTYNTLKNLFFLMRKHDKIVLLKQSICT